ncbi:Permease of the drug/metabolite transporter (DMT) superfamily [Octadecabacter temperatus]|uniref:EamA-like transporter family protein n=1 Tax=Octadecabacter temperatus TaxID=1458307 RepID=A0A0K0Y1K9_9RHOB|nr:DMT family transporter [Octadecabacter temperatus]AKS44828.1 EamA-like transporter family protein [Octadecabacter temperatus]SIO34809.1 Permease of the drug/metabolite transporter (DMT) superfamily [Octadecabacter temperatus]
MTLSDNMRAALLIMASMAAFTVNDALMKLASPNLPFFQQIFMRGALITIGLFILAAIWGHLRFKPDRKDRLLTALRTLAEAVGTVFFLTALFSIPIANLSAILQALPLTVTLAAAVFLGEPVGWRRIVAILIGFVGVAIIIRPEAGGFSIYALYGVAAVIAVTFRDLAARKLSKAVPSSRVALSAAIGVTLMAGVGSVIEQEVWVLPNLHESLLLLGAAVCLMVGYISAVAGMRLGEIGFVAPFRYTSLIVALFLGLVFFNEWPDFWTMVGAGIVVTTGLFTIYRERATAGKPSIGLRVR